jgi:hypothetical protein
MVLAQNPASIEESIKLSIRMPANLDSSDVLLDVDGFEKLCQKNKKLPTCYTEDTAELWAFEAKRTNSRRDSRIKYSDEPDLGVPAFSRTHEERTRVEILALKDNLAVALQFEVRGADSMQLRQFARRVLAKL